LPARNKPAHAKKLRGELIAAGDEAQRQRTEKAATHPNLVTWQADGVVLTFKSDPHHELKLEGLERRSKGIVLLSLSEEDGCQIAKVFVPQDMLVEFLRLVDKYAANVFLVFTVDQADVAAIKVFCTSTTLSLNDVLEFSTHAKELLNVEKEVFVA
jgi:hypothetical protein